MSDSYLDNWTAFRQAYAAGHDDYVIQAKRQSDFYNGDQWDKEDIEALGDRPALTFNEIFRIVNTLIGHYSTQRADITFKPRRMGATDEVARTLTKVVDSILDENGYIDTVEPQMFQDGLVEDRGYLDVRVDFQRNVLGEITIRALNPRTVIPAPDAEGYDPATWSEFFIDSWLSLDEIELYYGEDARRSIESRLLSGDFDGLRAVQFDTFGKDVIGSSWRRGSPLSPDQLRHVRSVRVIERQHRRLTRVREFVSLITGETRPVPETWTEDRINAVAQQYGLGVRTAFKSRVRWTVTTDTVELFDDWSPYDEFTIIPYFPYFRRGRPSGVVKHLIGPQEYLNKVESQSLHIINTTANSGWMVEEGSLANMTPEELEERGAETGLVMVKRRNREWPRKIDPNAPPSGLENFSAKARNYIANIPGIAALLGAEPNAEVSGVLLDRAMSRALVAMQPVFTNLAFTRKLLARRLLSLIQKFYTEPRVFRVVDWRSADMTDEEIQINIVTSTGEVLNNVTVGEYDVSVSSAPVRDTFEETQFAQMIEMRNAGVMIPDHHVIMTSNLAGKQHIADEVKQLQGFGEQTPEQQIAAELQFREMLGRLAELEARTEKLRADAALSAARAQGVVSSEQRETVDMLKKYEMELARLRADIAKAAANLENKLILANVHAGTKERLTRYTTLMKRQTEEDRQSAELERDVVRATLSDAVG